MTLAKVLLVDDEEAFVKVMTGRLTRRDFEVVSALSGRDALNILDEQGDIEVVVLDLRMPGLDGLDTLREIKKRHPLTEVIMLTGFGSIGSGIEGMKLGAFDYLTKPCDVDLLTAKVQAAASRKWKHEDQVIAIKSSWSTAREEVIEKAPEPVKRALESEKNK